MHLDQVLLAGQSMPVPQQYEDVDAADAAQADGLPVRGADEVEAGDVDRDGFCMGHRYVSILPGQSALHLAPVPVHTAHR
jgi:hypothetical protein